MKQQLQQAQWLEFVEKFNGYEKEVTKSFAQAYNGIRAYVRDVKLVLTESFVAEATGLPRIRENKFKTERSKKKIGKSSLKT